MTEPGPPRRRRRYPMSDEQLAEFKRLAAVRSAAHSTMEYAWGLANAREQRKPTIDNVCEAREHYGLPRVLPFEEDSVEYNIWLEEAIEAYKRHADFYDEVFESIGGQLKQEE